MTIARRLNFLLAVPLLVVLILVVLVIELLDRIETKWQTLRLKANGVGKHLAVPCQYEGESTRLSPAAPDRSTIANVGVISNG
jgi:hypothetical protein